MGKLNLTTGQKVEAILVGLEARESRDDLAKVLGYKNWRGIITETVVESKWTYR